MATRHERDEESTLYELPLVQQVEELTNDMVDRAEHLPSRARVDRVERKAQRGNTVTIAIVALIAVAALLWGAANSRANAETAAANQINAASIDALNDARDQLKAQGVPEADLPPVITAPPPGDKVDINALAQAAAALVLADIKNDPAYRGATGLAGELGKPCDPIANVLCVGPQGIQGIQGLEGPEGKQGQPGINGNDGTNGMNGADGPHPVSAAFHDVDPDLLSVDCKYETTYSDGEVISATAASGACEDNV